MRVFVVIQFPQTSEPSLVGAYLQEREAFAKAGAMLCQSEAGERFRVAEISLGMGPLFTMLAKIERLG